MQCGLTLCPDYYFTLVESAEWDAARAIPGELRTSQAELAQAFGALFGAELDVVAGGKGGVGSPPLTHVIARLLHANGPRVGVRPESGETEDSRVTPSRGTEREDGVPGIGPYGVGGSIPAPPPGRCSRP